MGDEAVEEVCIPQRVLCVHCHGMGGNNERKHKNIHHLSKLKKLGSEYIAMTLTEKMSAW